VLFADVPHNWFVGERVRAFYAGPTRRG
jgi:hypothetical protein